MMAASGSEGSPPANDYSRYSSKPPASSVVSERRVEDDLVERLRTLKYLYRPEVRDRLSLESNFRGHFEDLNQVKLTDGEFARLLEQLVTPDVYEAARLLRERNSFEREDGTPLFYTLVNTTDWCKNTFEVISQFRVNTDYSHHRYDVILLMNGIPVVQIELKTLTVSPRRAMQQIVEYKNDTGNGYAKTLLCFLQFFVVSNRSDTWYFANNNSRHFTFNADERFLPIYQFAREDNQRITHLDDFAETFLAKCHLAEMIGRYMVLVASERRLMMMRPYQIYAVKAIVGCIRENCGNGYIWHTTGSGKTLTSFKASTLLKDNPDIEKCLFIVDRKDLDRQTREEFNRFQEGCVEENTNTEMLVCRLLSDDYADKVIVTTIQKLGLALDGGGGRNYRERLTSLGAKRMALIFDECHRSQFGENHKAIREFFPNAQLFGFTGTPIFEENATCQQITGEQASYVTTRDTFQQQLHAYTITHAIEDRNVLRFHVDYYRPDGNPAQDCGAKVQKRKIVETILEKHGAMTAERRFNAVLATASINDAIEYHGLFNDIQEKRRDSDPGFKTLNIACVFSPPADGNKDIQQIQEDLLQEKMDNTREPDRKKAALKSIIADYNGRFDVNHSINEFDLYYQDVQKRIKDQQFPTQDFPQNQKIDVVIVVDMLLTGFDSKYLNTLYVDKNLKHHGLIQAFSRTNRALNDTKPHGNILDFRQQEQAVNEAITLFSGVSARPPAEIWLTDSAPVVINKFGAAVKNLDDFMQSQGLACAPEEVANLKGDAARSQFINLFKEVQRLNAQLGQYTDLTAAHQEEIENFMSGEHLQGFRGVYLDTVQRLETQPSSESGVNDEQARQADFELVLFASAMIDYDYIMALIADYSQQEPEQQKMSRGQLVGLIQSDAKFMDERDDIVAYIDTLQAGVGLNEEEIRRGFERFREEKRASALVVIADRHGLDLPSLQEFLDTILRRMIFDGEKLSDLLAPLDLGWKARTQKELALMKDLIPHLRRMAHGRKISGLGAYER